ncbi:NADH dehydrogenase [ubiquinone] 1 alpha subcomplex subunit 9, mitochondrial-like [Argiope bruennichi]|uniref:NADH dehydrogenase [ubiquinone] 1 alpha subcomplex subunit 9, mitochondrial n=1 Tax=Argiope bruennichi TaxID=94029 RepID=A0A8T0ECZ2_ARGBR|nr:NADH dehydrogenase [ubiquinone] 1 alpha subcomplex subunit 9, mitochondrial-like [Argiope bruennichi]XP_055953845.1 NADH dehydrogenase [ubiquinone] 1 alpha subcomplex subunit 9, mitochondrial-like [Argiope bruennichi]KAF8770721.1 NADH dehydrogenase 1 alpha like protein [Argiope bruennichi]
MASVMFRLPKTTSPIQVIFLRQTPARFASTDVVETEDKKFPKVKSDYYSLKRGTGGRSSFSGKVATVFGATGFLGRAVVNQLGKNGTQVIIPYRGDPYLVTRLKMSGDLGQILFTHFHLKDEESLYKAMRHSNVVINLIGKPFETPNFTFEDVHVTGARNIARIARECGVQTLIHMSSLNACEKPKPVILRKGSQFLASKWRGEQAVREEFPDAIIFRPSDMWGQQDHFLNYYMHQMRRTWRAMSLWNKGVGIVKQPVFYSDVAKGILKSIFDPAAAGHTFQAVGPHRYELSELMDWFHRIMNRTRERMYYRLDIRLDATFWARLILSEMLLTRYRQLSWERLERECITDQVLPELPTLEDLEVNLTPLEERIFYELKIYRLHAYHDPLLSEYIRPVEPCPLARE